MVQEKEADQNRGGQIHPPVGGEDAIVLKLGEEIAPTGDGLADAEAEEGERDFSENELRNEQDGYGQQRGVRLRENVAAQDVPVACAHGARGEDETALARTEDNAANEARGTRPADESGDGDEKQEGVNRPDAKRQNGANGEKKIEPRQGEKEFHEAHQRGVGPAAVKSRQHAQGRAREESDGCSENAGEYGNSAAEEHAREKVAGDVIGAKEPEPARAFHAEEMKAGVPAAQDGVTRAGGEKLQRERAGSVLFDCGGGVVDLESVNEWTQMKGSSGIEEVEASGSNEREIAVLFGEIIGREKPGKEQDEVQRRKGNEPESAMEP